MTDYAYVRVSTKHQKVERQVRKMLELGIPEENIFVDHASGRSMDRPAWNMLAACLVEGDRVILDSIDRLGRNYDEVCREWRTLTREEGVRVKALEPECMDSDRFAAMGPLGPVVEDMMLAALAWAAQHELDELARRREEGMELARAAGKQIGRPSGCTATPEELRDVARLLSEGAVSKPEAARRLGVSVQTVYNWLHSGRLAA